MDQTSDTLATRDPIATKTVAKRDVAKIRRMIENPVAEKLNGKSTATLPTRVKIIPKVIATIVSNGKKVKPIAVKQRTADEYLEEIGIRTRLVPLESRPRRYGNARTIRLITETPNRTMASVAGKSVGVNFG